MSAILLQGRNRINGRIKGNTSPGVGDSLIRVYIAEPPWAQLLAPG